MEGAEAYEIVGAAKDGARPGVVEPVEGNRGAVLIVALCGERAQVGRNAE